MNKIYRNLCQWKAQDLRINEMCLFWKCGLAQANYDLVREMCFPLILVSLFWLVRIS